MLGLAKRTKARFLISSTSGESAIPVTACLALKRGARMGHLLKTFAHFSI